VRRVGLGRAHRQGELDTIDEKTREQLETQYFKKRIDEVWAETEAYYQRTDPAQLEDDGNAQPGPVRALRLGAHDQRL
jgi:hypothetical protein